MPASVFRPYAGVLPSLPKGLVQTDEEATPSPRRRGFPGRLALASRAGPPPPPCHPPAGGSLSPSPVMGGPSPSLRALGDRCAWPVKHGADSAHPPAASPPRRAPCPRRSLLVSPSACPPVPHSRGGLWVGSVGSLGAGGRGLALTQLAPLLGGGGRPTWRSRGATGCRRAGKTRPALP